MNAPELSPDIGAAGPAELAADTPVIVPVVALAGTVFANNGPVVMFGATGVQVVSNFVLAGVVSLIVMVLIMLAVVFSPTIKYAIH